MLDEGTEAERDDDAAKSCISGLLTVVVVEAWRVWRVTRIEECIDDRACRQAAAPSSAKDMVRALQEKKVSVSNRLSHQCFKSRIGKKIRVRVRLK